MSIRSTCPACFHRCHCLWISGHHLSTDYPCRVKLWKRGSIRNYDTLDPIVCRCQICQCSGPEKNSKSEPIINPSWYQRLFNCWS